MTERKPPNLDVETWIDRQIREAGERGEFDDLPGSGKPLPGLDRPHDELWWIKDKVLREGLSTEALLPTPLQLRKEIERLPDTVGELPTERAVRDVVNQLNVRVAEWLRTSSGPRVRVAPVDADRVVEQWRSSRPPGGCSGPPEAAAPAPRARRERWWTRLVRRATR